MDNNKDNKKKFVVIIGTLAILLLLVGATYAYFALNVNQGNTKTNINASTTPVDNISLKQSNSNLHITLRPDDMALSTQGDYYAVTEEDQNYDKYENIVSLAELTAKGGAKNTAYNCEVKVTITKNTGDTMTSVLNTKDAEVRLSFGDLLEDIDLVDLKNTENIKRTGHITLINNSNDFINAYLKVSNKEDDQAYLANKTLDININTEVTKCDVIGTSKIELALRNTNESGTLSKELKGGMFRYQGTADDVTDNYICFGTTEQQNCLDYPDKYMYRIIGVTPEGRLKVIKKEALEEGMQWWNNYDDDIEFPESKIYEAINGTSFLENKTYITEEWKDKIYDNIWTYGDMLSDNPLGAKQTSEELYQTETGKKITQWYNYATAEIPGAIESKVNFSSSSHNGETVYYTNGEGNWTKTFKSKVSLMYLHDYHYSVSDDTNCQYHAEKYTECKTGWMHLSQNDSSITGDGIHEWTMSRYGWDYVTGYFYGLYIWNTGYTLTWNLSGSLSVRPVFFLKSDIEISGKGTETEPYMIEL